VDKLGRFPEHGTAQLVRATGTLELRLSALPGGRASRVTASPAPVLV